jgi:hypothetical protein
LKAEKDFLSVEHNKLQKYYKNMGRFSLSKKRGERSSKWTLVMYIKPRMRYKGNLTKGMKKWTKICRGK